MSAPSAGKTTRAAWELGARLPGVELLLADGTLDLPRARLVTEVFADLSDEDAAKAEGLLIPRLAEPPRKTYPQVERIATAIAAEVDPGLAERRRRAAERHLPRVTMFREQSGAAALSGRDLPADETLAALARVNARAGVYQESGAFPQEGMDRLRATAYLDILNEVAAEDRIAYGRLSPDDAPTDADAPDDGDAPDDDDLDDRAPEGPDAPEAEAGLGGSDCPCGECDGRCAPPDDSHFPDDGDFPDDGPDDGEPATANPVRRTRRRRPRRRRTRRRRPGPATAGPRGGGQPTRRPARPGAATVPPARRPGGRPDDRGIGPDRAAAIAVPAAPRRAPADPDRPGPPARHPPRPRRAARRGTRPRHPRPRPVPGPGRHRRPQPPHHRLRHRHQPRRHRDRPRLRQARPASPDRPRPAPPLVALPARINLTITKAAWPNYARNRKPGRPDHPDRRTDPDSGRPAGRSPAAAPASPGDPDWCGPWALTLPSGLEFTVNLAPVPTFECDHRNESHAYQPNATLRHLVQIRDHACTFPPCTRHARESDFEHAVPYDQGGRTCACNAGARSRKCHRVKQSPGWNVTQPTRLAPVDHPPRPHLHPRPEEVPGVIAAAWPGGRARSGGAAVCSTKPAPRPVTRPRMTVLGTRVGLSAGGVSRRMT